MLEREWGPRDASRGEKNICAWFEERAENWSVRSILRRKGRPVHRELGMPDRRLDCNTVTHIMAFGRSCAAPPRQVVGRLPSTDGIIPMRIVPLTEERQGSFGFPFEYSVQANRPRGDPAPQAASTSCIPRKDLEDHYSSRDGYRNRCGTGWTIDWGSCAPGDD